MAHKANNSRRTIAVDFDGVIAEYDGYKGAGVLGKPRPDVVEALRVLNGEGWKIVIHTTRGQKEIAAYLEQHGIPCDEVNRNSDYQTQGPKPVADVYWDDRALCYSGDARKDLDLIRNFRTWSGRE
jgi:adenylylsulfate kinase